MKNARALHSAVNLFSGVADVTGYVDSHPRILGGCIPDPLSGPIPASRMLAALHTRKRTGKGQFVDVAMYEAMLTMIPEAVIDLHPQRCGARAHRQSRSDQGAARHLSLPGRRHLDRDQRRWRGQNGRRFAARPGIPMAGRPRRNSRRPRHGTANISALDLAVEQLDALARRCDEGVAMLQAAGVPPVRCFAVTSCSITSSCRRAAWSSPPTILWRSSAASSDCRGGWTALASNTAAPRCWASTRKQILNELLGIDEAEYSRARSRRRPELRTGDP